MESLPGALRVRFSAMCLMVVKFWGVVGSDAAVVIAEDHVHDPVQAVLDIPFIMPLMI